MTFRLLFCLLLIAPAACAQRDSSGFHPGVQLSATLSNLYESGITPSLTAEFRGHRLAFGNRFVFDDAFSKKLAYYDSRDVHVFDASYRYYPFRSMEKLRPFPQLSSEYNSTHTVYTHYYDAGAISTHGPIFDHDFQGRDDNRSYEWTLHLGAGVDYCFAKQFYCTASAGFGAGFQRFQQEIIDTGTGEVMYAQNGNWHLDEGGRWIASVGVGYRF